MLRVADCVIQRVIPQPTEWENIGNQINAGINVFLTLFRPDLINAIPSNRRNFPQLFWGEQPPFMPIGVGGGNF